jgi:hypothetical protein
LKKLQKESTRKNKEKKSLRKIKKTCIERVLENIRDRQITIFEKINKIKNIEHGTAKREYYKKNKENNSIRKNKNRDMRLCVEVSLPIVQRRVREEKKYGREEDGFCVNCMFRVIIFLGSVGCRASHGQYCGRAELHMDMLFSSIFFYCF